MRYEVKGEWIYWGERCVGNTHRITVDVRQDVVQAPQLDIVREKLVVGDYLFMVGEQVVVVEEKRSSDLLSSFHSRRLQRQLRQVLQASDIPVLALRLNKAGEYSFLLSEMDVVAELVKWEVLGGYIVFLPHQDALLISTIRTLQSVLVPGRHQLSIVAGTDQVRKDLPDVPLWASAIRKMVKGLGPSQLKLLVGKYGGEERPLVAALSASGEEWKEVGIRADVIRNRDEVMYGTGISKRDN